MFIYFVTTNLKAAEQEAEEQGWYRVAIARWIKPGDRSDIRPIFYERDFVNIPSGNWFLPGQSLRDCVGGEPYKFKMLVEKGIAGWVENPLLGEQGTIELVDSIQPPPPPLEDFITSTKVEEASPLHSIQDIREKAREAARRQRGSL